MTKEAKEAIDLLDNLIGMVEDNHNSDYDTALQMGIKALEQKPCEDAISRQAVLDALSHMCSEDENGITVSRANVNSMLRLLPPVTPQPKTERCKWIRYDYRTMCPKEHIDVDNPYWRIPENRMETLKYCPYCGKEIEVEE